MTAAPKIAEFEDYSSDVEDKISLSELKQKLNLYHSFVEKNKITLREKISDEQLEELIDYGKIVDDEFHEDGKCLAARLLEEIHKYEKRTGHKVGFKDLEKYGFYKTRLEWESAISGAEKYADKLAKKEKDMNELQIYRNWLERNEDKHGVLNKKQYNVLTDKIRKGGYPGYQARKELANHYLKMVVYVAQRHPASGMMDIMELISIGNLAIHEKIAQAFNPDGKAAFGTYSYKSLWTLFSFKMDEYKKGVRIPVDLTRYIKPLYKFANFYFANKGETPSDDVIKKEFPFWIQDERLRKKILKGDTLGNLIRAYRLGTSPPLIATYNDKGVSASPLKAINAREHKQKIHEIAEFLLSNVKPRYRKILKLRFGIPPPERTLQEVGDILGVTREAVRQSEKKAKEDLKMFNYVLGDILD